MSFAPLSFKVASTLTAYRIVKLSASQTVALMNNATTLPVGVTTDDVKDTNQAIPVAVSGIAKVYMNDTCSAGALVMSDANGLGVPAVANTAGIYVVGMVVSGAVSATGTLADVLLNPYQLQLQ
jgi:hypothetical protein